jgi:hypothetical protein
MLSNIWIQNIGFLLLGMFFIILATRPFVSAVVLGISTRAQMLEDLEAADWDMPREDWNAIKAATRPAEDNLTWFNRQNYQRVLAAAEFHDERVDLL